MAQIQAVYQQLAETSDVEHSEVLQDYEQGSGDYSAENSGANRQFDSAENNGSWDFEYDEDWYGFDKEQQTEGSQTADSHGSCETTNEVDTNEALEQDQYWGDEEYVSEEQLKHEDGQYWNDEIEYQYECFRIDSEAALTNEPFADQTLGTTESGEEAAEDVEPLDYYVHEPDAEEPFEEELKEEQVSEEPTAEESQESEQYWYEDEEWYEGNESAEEQGKEAAGCSEGPQAEQYFSEEEAVESKDSSMPEKQQYWQDEAEYQEEWYDIDSDAVGEPGSVEPTTADLVEILAAPLPGSIWLGRQAALLIQSASSMLADVNGLLARMLNQGAGPDASSEVAGKTQSGAPAAAAARSEEQASF